MDVHVLAVGAEQQQLVRAQSEAHSRKTGLKLCGSLTAASGPLLMGPSQKLRRCCWHSYRCMQLREIAQTAQAALQLVGEGQDLDYHAQRNKTARLTAWNSLLIRSGCLHADLNGQHRPRCRVVSCDSGIWQEGLAQVSAPLARSVHAFCTCSLHAQHVWHCVCMVCVWIRERMQACMHAHAWVLRAVQPITLAPDAKSFSLFVRAPPPRQRVGR